MKNRFWLGTILGALGAVVATMPYMTSEARANCQNGPPAEAEFCKFFYYYRSANNATDPRVITAIGLTPGESLRNVAIIAGVSKYPNYTEQPELVAAKNDIEHLKALFLSQHFDEIILLENDDVNLTNLNYFLQTYMLHTANRFDKVRFVFAYSGHGVPASAQGDNSYLVLSDAKDGNDIAHFLSLGILRQYFSNLSPHLFQFLALINTCYGGGVFTGALSGGDIYETSNTAANALTAGAPDQLVYSFGHPGEGSIFFDSIVRGIEKAEAQASFHTSDEQGQTVDIKRPVIRLGDLFRYVHDTIKSINGYLNTKYSNPWEGSIAPPPTISLGGFFFLPGSGPTTVVVQPPTAPRAASPYSFAFGRHAAPTAAIPRTPAAPLGTPLPPEPPAGPTSSFAGRPGLKIFKTPGNRGKKPGNGRLTARRSAVG